MAKRDPKTPAKKRGRPKKKSEAPKEDLVIKVVPIETLEEKPFPKADVTVTRRDY